MRQVLLVIVAINLLTVNYVFSQIFVHDSISNENITITHYLSRMVHTDSLYSKLKGAECEKGMVFVMFSISSNLEINRISMSYNPNRKIMGLILKELKQDLKISTVEVKDWITKRFLLPVIYDFSCSSNVEKQEDKSYESLFLLQNFEYQPNLTFEFLQQIEYRQFVIVRPLFLKG